jgi:hypothetical protein
MVVRRAHASGLRETCERSERMVQTVRVYVKKLERTLPRLARRRGKS